MKSVGSTLCEFPNLMSSGWYLYSVWIYYTVICTSPMKNRYNNELQGLMPFIFG